MLGQDLQPIRGLCIRRRVSVEACFRKEVSAYEVYLGNGPKPFSFTDKLNKMALTREPREHRMPQRTRSRFGCRNCKLRKLKVGGILAFLDRCLTERILV